MFEKKALPFWCPQLPPFHGISFQSVACHSEGHQCRWKINIGGRGACMQDHDFFPKPLPHYAWLGFVVDPRKENMCRLCCVACCTYRHVNRTKGKCFLWWIYRTVLQKLLNYLRELRITKLQTWTKRVTHFHRKEAPYIKRLFLFWCRWITKIWKLQGNCGMINVQFSDGSTELLSHLVKIIIINKLTYLFIYLCGSS
jgi:hypothetical protein